MQNVKTLRFTVLVGTVFSMAFLLPCETKAQAPVISKPAGEPDEYRGRASGVFCVGNGDIAALLSMAQKWRSAGECHQLFSGFQPRSNE